ncbi:MAG: ABC transporter ATP-binding protein [Candidatus Aminicenantes bacterium]|nr:ABC transporter ATP-binding protein [Candidatus Aminicenantes bacterium]MDH5383964.1 ABC transporter ATP-binding protein [Candidatus Aminicenantes bacterium]MDH5745110.1 ABC transporter ATP-binding protein [Candidatus Aminicenantes bacterium]
MLKIEHLSKTFDSIKAVDDISFEVKKGEIFGFLGPNGAGKTTAISMISGLLKPDSGKITIDSMDLESHLKRIKKIMGVVPQDMAFYEELTASENLLFWGRLQGVKRKILEERIQIYLQATGLLGRENDPLKKYSGGMKRRINLIIGLIHQPKLLLLDEPTIGIDVQTRLNIFNLIKEASLQGTTILYTTHNLQEAEELCHRIAIMDQGKILAMGTLEELIQIVGEKDIIIISGKFSVDQGRKISSFFKDATVLSLKEGKIILSLEASKKMPLLLEEFFKHGISIDDVSIKQPNLESVFLKLTGRELRE